MSDDDVINDFLPGIYGEVPEIIREVWHRMPFGQEFMLGNGRVGRFKPFVEPRLNQRTGMWEFGFDIVFDKGSPDHIEFFVKHTGGGGSVGDTIAVPAPLSANN